MRHIELIGKFFHNLILYLLLIFVCLLPKFTPGNTGGLTTWWISKPEIERYKTVPVWRNHERWCEPSDVPQDTSCTHVTWHIRRWYLTWVQTPRWWSGRVLSLAWFLIFISWCKYSVFFSKKVSHSYECDTLFNVFFHFAMRFPGIYRKMVNPAFYPLRLHFQPFSPAIR